jgi:peptide/nickel transport system ATP-binding protein
MMADTPALVVSNLAVGFLTVDGEVQAVRDVSFEVGRGEIVGLVGESGSGKSATALAIMGLLPHASSRVRGSATVSGVDLLALPPRELAKVRGRKIGMIFQEPMSALDPLFRIGDQIAETVRAHQRVSWRAARARAVEILGEVGIPDAASRARAYPHQLSGGMRQRVMIAMALVSEPSVLIADEPTTALDVTVQAQILGLLRRLSKDHGTAVVLITHDLGVVAETCSRIHVMYAGEIVEACGVDAALLAPGHPYTSALIQCIPRAGQHRQPLQSIPRRRLSGLEGMPTGCRFLPRCEHAADICRTPQSLVGSGGRSVRCIRHDQINLPGAVERVPQ